MLPKKLISSLEKELTKLWSTWSGLGLYSEIKPVSASPETCLIGLACIGQYDQRLFDEALSLLKSHSGIIRMPFINYWMNMMDNDSKHRLALILGFCGISKKHHSKALNPTRNLFINTQQTPYINGRLIDPSFKDYGFIRNEYIMSSNVPSMLTISKRNAFVKMRYTSGFQAQSDAWVYLLHYQTMSVPKLQSILGITSKSAWNILQSICQAGWITKKTIAKIDHYKITSETSRTFSYLKTSKLQCTPVDWIRLSHSLSAVGMNKVSDSYYDFLEDKLSKELPDLEVLSEKIANL
jgi:hypothetical protein